MTRRAAVAIVTVALLLIAAAVPSGAYGAELHTGRAGIELIEHFEGYFPQRYLDPAGVPTQCFGATGAELRGLPAYATRGQCRAQLRHMLDRTYEPPVRKLFRRGGPLHGLFNQYRFDALTSASLNLGTGVAQCYYASMCAAIRSRSPQRIADAFLLYTRDIHGRVLPGLVRRRAAERALFLRQPTRFEGFMKKEQRWIKLYDRLRKQRRKPVRQAELQALMRKQARRIVTAARRDGVDGGRIKRRQTRRLALERRAAQRPIARAGVA